MWHAKGVTCIQIVPLRTLICVGNCTTLGSSCVAGEGVLSEVSDTPMKAESPSYQCGRTVLDGSLGRICIKFGLDGSGECNSIAIDEDSPSFLSSTQA